MQERKISVTEKVGYGLGDMASHIVFDNVMVYMMFFYTDVYGISATFVGTLFLVVRIFDAVNDPFMGLLADRTKSRMGKFRPWILFGALPFGAFCVLAYSTPQFGMTGKMVYAAVTYTLLMIFYTMVNIPYCALGGVITAEPKQRMSLQSWRFALATIGGMLSTVFMLPLVKWVGHGNTELGYRGAISLLAVLAVVMLIACGLTTKERLLPESYQDGMLSDLRDILTNDQWRIVAVITILTNLAVALRGGVMMYYVTWLMKNPEVFSWFLGTYTVGIILGSMAAKPVTDQYCKVTVFWWCSLALTVLSCGMFFLPIGANLLTFGLIFVIGVLHQLITPIQWVMMSDAVDYGEWKQGKRLTGVSFAGILFVLKSAFAVGGAMIGWMLGAAGYVPHAQSQNSTTLLYIVLLFTALPAVCYFLGACVAKYFYQLKTPFLQQILGELKQQSPVETSVELKESI